jgi:hypothetical protein
VTVFSSFRSKAATLVAGISLCLTGCFISPGSFTSELTLAETDQFTFVYDGEIFFLGLSKLAQMGATRDEPFSPTCYDDETFDTRDCTASETAEQRREWDADASERAAKRKRKAEQRAVIMGGIDPSDPKAADELVRLLERQQGWEQVEHLGDGLFKVRYAISGTLTHDFMFPMIEGFPPTNPFVQTFARKNGQLRIYAPGFIAQGGDSGLGGMMGGKSALAGLRAMTNDAGPDVEMPSAPVLDGTFTIRTTGAMAIRANNTDSGPETTATGEQLTWKITSRTAQIPTALIELRR